MIYQLFLAGNELQGSAAEHLTVSVETCGGIAKLPEAVQRQRKVLTVLRRRYYHPVEPKLVCAYILAEVGKLFQIFIVSPLSGK